MAGVCIARAQIKPGAVLGMYSTVGNVESLLAAHKNLAAVVSRSHPVVAATQPASKPVPKVKVPQVDRTADRLRAN